MGMQALACGAQIGIMDNTLDISKWIGAGANHKQLQGGK